jgi:hypothetical protein
VKHRIPVDPFAPCELPVGVSILLEPFVMMTANLFSFVDVSVILFRTKTGQGEKTIDFVVQYIVPSIRR